MRIAVKQSMAATGQWLLPRTASVTWLNTAAVRTVCSTCIDAEPSYHDALEYYSDRDVYTKEAYLDAYNFPTKIFTEALLADTDSDKPRTLLELGGTFNPSANSDLWHHSVAQRIRYHHRLLDIKLVQSDILAQIKNYGPFSSWRITQNMGRWMTLADTGAHRSFMDVALERVIGAYDDRAKLMMMPCDMRSEADWQKLTEATGIDTYRWIVGSAILCHCDDKASTTCGGLEPQVDALVAFMTTRIMTQLDSRHGMAILTGIVQHRLGMEAHDRSKVAVIAAADRINQMDLGFKAKVAPVGLVEGEDKRTLTERFKQGAGFELRIFASPPRLGAAADKDVAREAVTKLGAGALRP